MRRWNSRITVLGLACAGLLLAGAPAFAQTSGSSGAFGGSGSSGGSFGGSSSFGGGGAGGMSSGGSGSGFGGSGGSSFSGGSGSGFGSGSSSGNSSFGGASGIRPGGQSSTSSIPGRSGPSAAVGATSFLGAYYGNPLAQGLNVNQTNFGAPLFNLTTTGQTGTASILTTNQASGYFGAPIGVRRLPAYATTLKIRDMPAPATALQVRDDLRNMLARSGQLDSKDAVRVLMDGPAVVLQGEVMDDDERRLVENMVRLTPGVNAIRNELAARNPAP